MSRQPTRSRSHPESAVAREISHIRDLILLRDILAGRGATAAELKEYEQAIDVARSRLAEETRKASAPYRAAA